MSFKAIQSVLVDGVARKGGGGAISEDRDAIRNEANGEFWPSVGKSWQKNYRTLNSKFYGERQQGHDVHMVTRYARCDDQDYLDALHHTCKVEHNGEVLVKIIKIV